MLSVPYKQMVLYPVSAGVELRCPAGEGIMASEHKPILR